MVVTVDCAGICGSELGGYLGHNALRVPPLVMGHEFAGMIKAVADDVPGTFPTRNIGARVTANPMTWCNTCVFCQSGQQQLCRNRNLDGAHQPGGNGHLSLERC